MLSGLPPFYSEDVQEMYTKILTAEIEYGEEIPADAKDFLSKLLDRNPDTRLSDAAEMKRHPFYASIDWDKLIKKEMVPPFIPETSGEDDLRNIDTVFVDESLESSEEKPEEGFTLENFTYVGGSS